MQNNVEIFHDAAERLAQKSRTPETLYPAIFQTSLHPSTGTSSPPLPVLTEHLHSTYLLMSVYPTAHTELVLRDAMHVTSVALITGETYLCISLHPTVSRYNWHAGSPHTIGDPNLCVKGQTQCRETDELI